MKILFDTNIILDVLLDRKPFSTVASELLSSAVNKELSGYLCATTITTIHYLMTKSMGAARSKKSLTTLLSFLEIAPVTKQVLVDALSLNFPDYEDAVIHEAARHAGAFGIVTRDPKGFSQSKLRIFTPDELNQILRTIQLDPSNHGRMI